MTKVGLKDTLSLLAKGYSKKEIDALAAIDDELDQKADQDNAADNKKEPDQKDANVPESTPTPDPEPDYKAMYEELLKKSKETEAKVTKLQQDNVHKDSAPASEEARQKEQESLEGLFRSFM